MSKNKKWFFYVEYHNKKIFIMIKAKFGLFIDLLILFAFIYNLMPVITGI